LAEAAEAWRALSKKLEGLEQRAVDEVTKTLRGSSWKGDAADAALVHAELLDDEFELASVQARNLSLVLKSAAEQIDRLQANLRGAVDGAVEVGLRVDDTGRVSLGSGLTPLANIDDAQAEERYRLGLTNAQIFGDLIIDLLNRATELDSRYDNAVRRYLPSFPGQEPWEWNDATADAQDTAGLYGLSEKDIPPPGSDPKRVAAWWAGLSDDQRTLYLTAYPDRIGALNGLPTTVRDKANKQELRNYIGDNAAHYRDNDNPHHDRAVALLGRLEASESDPAARRLYLLDIDNSGDGRAVVSVGNPDTAKHTAVLVPGVGTELDDMGGLINRAGRLQGTADGLTTDAEGDVAVIAWLGYDPPALDTDVVTAPFGVKSADGAESLDQFVDGIRASHEGPPAHVTVVGHSYGSTVVGHAASHGDGLAADDIVAVGSPGMRVDNASELNVGARHVWAGAAEGDKIAGAAGSVVHNTGPHEPEFGGNRFHVDTQGHSGYWDTDSESLRNQGLIIVGDYRPVGLDHGTRPPDGYRGPRGD
jgi:hypothetical protein